MVKFKAIILNWLGITVEELRIAKQRPPENDYESFVEFCRRICGPIVVLISEMIARQLYIDSELLQLLQTDQYFESSVNIAQVMYSMFPPLRVHLMSRNDDNYHLMSRNHLFHRFLNLDLNLDLNLSDVYVFSGACYVELHVTLI